MDDDIYSKYVAVTQQFRLDDLRTEISDTIASLDESCRPFVPTQFLRSLDMFLDSYGPQGWNAQHS